MECRAGLEHEITIPATDAGLHMTEPIPVQDFDRISCRLRMHGSCLGVESLVRHVTCRMQTRVEDRCWVDQPGDVAVDRIPGGPRFEVRHVRGTHVRFVIEVHEPDRSGGVASLHVGVRLYREHG